MSKDNLFWLMIVCALSLNLGFVLGGYFGTKDFEDRAIEAGVGKINNQREFEFIIVDPKIRTK